MDAETKEVFSEQKALEGLISHEGWAIARRKLTEKILELQMIGQVADVLDGTDAVKFMLEVKANKKTAEALFHWLRDIEGTASQAVETAPEKSHIIRLP